MGNRPIGSIGASSSGDGAIFTSTRRLWKGRRMRRGEERRGEPHACTTERRSDMEGFAKSRRTVASPPLRLSPSSYLQTSDERIPRRHSRTTATAPTGPTTTTKLNRPFRPIGSRSTRPPRRPPRCAVSSFLAPSFPTRRRSGRVRQECNNPFTTAIHLTSHPAGAGAGGGGRRVVTQRAFRSGISPPLPLCPK